MLEFKNLELKDIPVIKPYLKYKVENNCDCTIGGAFMWRDYFATQYAIFGEMLFLRANYLNGHLAYCFPLAEDIETALQVLKTHCELVDEKLVLCTITDAEMEYIDRVFPRYEAVKERDWFDYIYNSADMVSFAGRKYSGQRNHINKFKRLYEDYTFEIIDESNIGEARAFFEVFAVVNDKNTETYAEEAQKVLEVLDHYDEYGLMGGVLKVKDKVIGMSMGEIIGNTLFVHIEKADTSYHGAYQVLVQNFANAFVDKNVEYINREEDVGDEGLRTSKLSYHPVRLIEKSTVTII